MAVLTGAGLLALAAPADAAAAVSNCAGRKVRTLPFSTGAVHGQNDPWGAEPFRLGKGAKDSYVFTAPGMNHGANVAGLVPDEKALATARILEWAGASSAAVAEAKPLAKFDAKLDVRDVEREPALRP
jgi:hypothetical protein